MRRIQQFILDHPVEFYEKPVNISAICPRSKRKVWVSDWWCPSYTDRQTGKMYVWCTIRTGYDERDNVYFAHICFWGGDDTGMEAWVDSANIDDVIAAYKRYKKFVKKLPKGRALMPILIDNGFGWA